ncbi:MAG: hypothetical protein WC911_01740 [Thermoleophilia bacterium]
MKKMQECPEHGLYWGECPYCGRREVKVLGARIDIVGKPILRVNEAIRFAETEGR